MAHHHEIGDVVKAGNQFAGTVVSVTEDDVVVENRDGERRTFDHRDLKETA